MAQAFLRMGDRRLGVQRDSGHAKAAPERVQHRLRASRHGPGATLADWLSRIADATLQSLCAEPSIMGMSQTATDWTAAMVRDLPDDGRRYEVVDGELLVTPAPAYRHQRAVGELYVVLHTYLSAHRVGSVLVAPADVVLDLRTLVQPDLFVVPLVGGRPPENWDEAGAMLLAVEVLSPSSARADRQIKRRRYQRAGVPEYWIVDLDARLIERWTGNDPRPDMISERLVWQPDPARGGLEIDVVALFGVVIGCAAPPPVVIGG